MKKLLLLLALSVIVPLMNGPIQAAPKLQQAKLKWPTFRQNASRKSVPEVAAIQYLLRSRGFYQSKPDGVFGAQTAASVRAFQRKNGLKADGVVAAQTFSKLIKPLKRGDKGDMVRALQTLPREPTAEDDTQPFHNIPVDGIFGMGVDGIVRSYQDEWAGYPESHVLESNGIAGLKTWYYLFGGQLNY